MTSGSGQTENTQIHVSERFGQYLKKSKMDFQGLWTLSFLPSKWDYWEMGQLNKLFLFVKDIGNVYIFAWESKNLHAIFKCVL